VVWEPVIEESLQEADETDQQHPSAQLSPRQVSRPSLSATAAMTSAAAGSAHHQPASAFASSPTRSAIERYAQSWLWLASLTVADDPSACPTLRFARARSGMVGAVNAARPMPTQEAPG
jgi:hypothetical protein